MVSENGGFVKKAGGLASFAGKDAEMSAKYCNFANRKRRLFIVMAVAFIKKNDTVSNNR